jgi:hypothetical protein
MEFNIQELRAAQSDANYMLSARSAASGFHIPVCRTDIVVIFSDLELGLELTVGGLPLAVPS